MGSVVERHGVVYAVGWREVKGVKKWVLQAYDRGEWVTI